MAGGLNWALEKMGWRVPEEDVYAEETESVAEVHEYPFPAIKHAEQEDEATEVTRKAYSVREEAIAVGVDDRRRIVTVHPRSYSDALGVGESFRDGIPVIMNLTDMDDAEARRIIDFAAGLTFGLQGEIERVTTRVFLLSPRDTIVTSNRGSSYR